MTFPMKQALARPGFILILGALPLFAQTPRLELNQLERLTNTASEVVDVTLDGSTLQMATQFLDKDPETKDLVRNLKGIYVKSFQFEKADAYSQTDIDAIRAQVPSPAWSRIVHVQSKKDGQVDIFVLGDGKGSNLGLVVIAAEAKELTVVNLVGSIDLQKLGSLEGKLGIPRLGTTKNGEKGGVRHEAK